MTDNDDIERHIRAMELQRSELKRIIQESEQTLTETDEQIAEFKRRQNLRLTATTDEALRAVMEGSQEYSNVAATPEE